MNLFELKKYQWWDYMESVMRYVNLEKISFEQNNLVQFSFINSYDGGFYRNLICKQVLKCCIENDPFDDNEPFAYFVPDVYKKELSREELSCALSYTHYGYPVDPAGLGRRWLVAIIGSEIYIELICGEVIVTEKSAGEL